MVADAAVEPGSDVRIPHRYIQDLDRPGVSEPNFAETLSLKQILQYTEHMHRR